MARALHERGDYRGAIENYLKAIRQAPDEPRLYLSIAKSYEALDRPADVITAYTRYLDLEPESNDAEGIRRRMEQLARPIGSDPDRPHAP
jgi:tetratricopeptide (TPR) repeat protein